MKNITDIVEKLNLNASTKVIDRKTNYKFFPKDYDELKNLVNKLINERGEDADLNDINTSKITDMSSLFYPLRFKIRNINISYWDVTNVISMNNMFVNCKKFNCDLSYWMPINLETCKNMLEGCIEFNSNMFFNTPKLTDTYKMFNGCVKFNKNLSKLNTLNLVNAEGMFMSCENFNQDISNWKLPKIQNINWMFSNCISFNQDLSKWKISKSVAKLGTFLKCKNLDVIPLWFKTPKNK